ncbi:MAG: glycoside hydrolase family 78 protein [Anaerolineae bacterium]|nr:glycoside hydrolase family 78 protein [Anaerolineae bacterium]
MQSITNLVCEYRPNPLGIDVIAPRLSWQMQSDRRGARQTAYRILAATDPQGLREGQVDLWDSSKIETDQSIHIPYAGQALRSRQRVYWQVTVWDQTGQASQSDPAWFEMGLLERSDWKADWIGAALTGGPRTTIPAPYLRRSFPIDGVIKTARFYVTALGLHECSINGQAVSDEVLSPGWTDFSKRIEYQVYDVTPLLTEGINVLGAILGDGWAVGHIGWHHRQKYADRPRLLAQLEIALADGRMITIATDDTWKHQFGPLLENDLIMGEAYDARLEMPDWDRPGFDDKHWLSVERFEDPGIARFACSAPGVRRIDYLKPISDPVDRTNVTTQRYIFDLGQNMVGRVCLKGSAPAGTTVTLRFAEVLNPDGTLYTDNLRTARVIDYYTFKGDGEEVWEPKFTFHGFHYVELLGYPGTVADDTITGVVLHSDMKPTGYFECSDPLLNQLQHNIVWSQKGNFLHLPTDCPQRDERLGWTGDVQVFARTAAFNMEVVGLLTRWLEELADAQGEQGNVPPVVPQVWLEFTDDGGPAWADAAVIVPWTMYLCYGDQRILEDNYPTMTRFMRFIQDASPDYIRCAPEYEGWPGLGDWLSINADTPRDLIGTAFWAYDTSLMAQIAAVLGRDDDADHYRRLRTNVKQAFMDRFLEGSSVPVAIEQPSEIRLRLDRNDAISRGSLKAVDYGPISSQVFNTNRFTPTQTAYVLALYFDLLPEELRALAAAELAADVERRDMHLSTGFVGAPYLSQALSCNGQLDTAYALLFQKSWPSWIYSVTQGATTVWERWDGWTEENGFEDPVMNSFNHYAYGSIGAWLYSVVAGIELDPAQPGYKHSILRPQPGGCLTHATGKLETPYGELVSQWALADDTFDWTIVVPPNTTATAHLPLKQASKVTLNGQAVTGSIHEVEAGKYHFVVS